MTLIVTTTSLPDAVNQIFKQHHAIYKLGQADKSQFDRILYDRYVLLEQSTQNLACQVDRALIAVRHQSQEWFTQMQDVVNTQIANVPTMQ
jgi:hypothetical protein